MLFSFLEKLIALCCLLGTLYGIYEIGPIILSSNCGTRWLHLKREFKYTSNSFLTTQNRKSELQRTDNEANSQRRVSIRHPTNLTGQRQIAIIRITIDDKGNRAIIKVSAQALFM